MIVAACDEGPGIGLGHRRRVECVQRELAALGLAMEVRRLRYEPDAAPIEGDIVFVDSYRVRADDTQRIRAAVVVAIDDIVRDLAVDLVIDPGPGARAPRRPQARQVLAGAEYALVDGRLRSMAAAPIGPNVRRVLVATGATDREGVGAGIASELARALPGAQVRLVVGAWGAGTDDDRVETLLVPSTLAPELAAADLVVTAGGVTMLEACCLGRPTVAFSIADNQSPALAGAAAAGAVLACDRTTAGAVAARLADDFDARARLSTSARALVDGGGAARVASVIESIVRQESRAS